MSTKANNGILSFFSDFKSLVTGVAKTSQATSVASMSEYLKSTAVEPVCLIERSLVNNDSIEDVLHTLTELYSVMYLQVASRLLTVDIDSVKVTRTLERLATERDVMQSIAGIESADKDFLSVALEAASKEKTNTKRSATRGSKSKENNKRSVTSGSKSMAPIHDNSTLSVGKLINLEVTNGNESLTVPVSVRLRTKSVSAGLIRDIFEANYSNFNMVERIKLYGLAELTFTEALTGSDLVAKQERIRISDKDGLLQSHFIKSLKDVGYTAVTGEVPINRASGIVVISDQGRSTIESSIRGKLSKFKDREKFFDGTATTILAVVDSNEEMVTIYYRGFKDESDYTFRMIARANKGSNDLTPVVKDMLQGHVPTL